MQRKYLSTLYTQFLAVGGKGLAIQILPCSTCIEYAFNLGTAPKASKTNWINMGDNGLIFFVFGGEEYIGG